MLLALKLKALYKHTAHNGKIAGTMPAGATSTLPGY